jgi:hypothetical protein
MKNRSRSRSRERDKKKRRRYSDSDRSSSSLYSSDESKKDSSPKVKTNTAYELYKRLKKERKEA